MKGFQSGNKLAIKRFCPNGHDKDLLGRQPHGNCLLCNRRRVRISQWNRLRVVNRDGSRFLEINYDYAYQVQAGKCAGCGTHQLQLNHRLCADHDHKTGIFRALLCRECNRALGLTRDNLQTLLNLRALVEANV